MFKLEKKSFYRWKTPRFYTFLTELSPFGDCRPLVFTVYSLQQVTERLFVDQPGAPYRSINSDSIPLLRSNGSAYADRKKQLLTRYWKHETKEDTMSINYFIRPYNLGIREGFSGKIVPVKTLTSKEVIHHMIQQGSTMTSADIKAALDDMVKAVEYLVLMGYSVQLDGLGTIVPTVKGHFESARDEYEAGRHRIALNIKPVKELIKSIRSKAIMEKVRANTTTPVIDFITDLATATENRVVTSGGEVVIEGANMVFDSTADDEGIFIVAGDDNAHKVTYLDAPSRGRMKFVMPDAFPAGTVVKLQVRSRLGSKTLRVGTSGAEVTVA
jgi:hypothetical protein